jgi:hypothetical protein
MDAVLRTLVGTECYVFLDDVIVYSRYAEEHAARLEHVLGRFEESSLQLLPFKSAFAKPQVQYLGFVLSENGVPASPEKVKTVKQYPTPKNV